MEITSDFIQEHGCNWCHHSTNAKQGMAGVVVSAESKEGKYTYKVRFMEDGGES